jgi:hypothetical protein
MRYRRASIRRVCQGIETSPAPNDPSGRLTIINPSPAETDLIERLRDWLVAARELTDRHRARLAG